MKDLNFTLNKTLLSLFAFVLLFTVSCKDDDDDMPMDDMSTETITELASANPDFSILVQVLTLPEMSDILAAASSPSSNLTVFAPKNSAFTALLQALGKSELSEIPTAVLKEIVKYHIIGDKFLSDDLANGPVNTLLDGESVTIDLTNGVMVNDAEVVMPNIEASNGVIHGIDAVLLPSFVIDALGTIAEVPMFNNDYSILYAALVEADLLSTVTTTQDITVFAPNNDAFANAGITSLDGISKEDLTSILQYHVIGSVVKAANVPVNGDATMLNQEKIYIGELANGDLKINGLSKITGIDIMKSNGVIHTIDRTLTPPARNTVDILAAISQMSGEKQEFTTLVGILTSPDYADILNTLNTASDVTIFAPTDAAFAAISSTIETLTVDQIKQVLTYHVDASRTFSTDLMNGQTIGTLNTSSDLTINIGNNVTISDTTADDANIIEVNKHGSNGVIHVIDKVLIPTLN